MEAIFLCLISLVLRVSGISEGDALYALKSSLVDPKDVLQSWDTSSGNPCIWFHVTCNGDGNVIRVDLGNGSLSGQLDSRVGQLTKLEYLGLYNNNISGKIPEELGNLENLMSLDLYFNNLSGPIPGTLGKLRKLHFLRLNNNILMGTIPMSLTAVSSLEILDLSNNKLTGDIPVNGSFSLFTPISFGNNRLSNNSPKRTLDSPSPISPNPLTPPTPSAEEDPLVHLGQLRRFSLHQLKYATNNFSNKDILGRGGFGKVYKGRLADGSLVAIKRLKEERTHGGELQFQTELRMISMAVHRNLLRLQGFCMTSTERLLVYPLMVNGSVASCLRERTDGQSPLDWPARKQIALGSARGLAYLHDSCDPKVIHRDVKAANILLDEEFEAVVADFGPAKLMDYNDTHVTTAVHGTLGHIAPEYLSTGRSSEKTDVYGYGIMLLELITGQRAFDLARLAGNEDVMLLSWVKELLNNKKLETLVDSKLQGNYIVEEVEELIQVALLCTLDAASDRPKMSDVVKMLEGDGLAERWEQWQKKDIICGEQNHSNFPSNNWIINDSTPGLRPEELSGPR
eukprot:XP_019079375.1 PREDICTED: BRASSINOSTEROID INSENSITIVE 1-associated receptor kinase 1 isoform X2 [Vitis vinifera]